MQPCATRYLPALDKTNIGPVVARLREEAAAHCEACAPPAFECPPIDSKSVRCVQGRCELGAARNSEHAD